MAFLEEYKRWVFDDVQGAKSRFEIAAGTVDSVSEVCVYGKDVLCGIC
jgi:hypothetical protein